MKNFGILFLLGILSNGLCAQQAMVASGGDSSDGLMNYSLGLVGFQTFFNNNSFIAAGVQHPYELFTSGDEIPYTLAIANETFISGSESCYGALQTITVAGIGNPVEVQSGAVVNFIAGSSVIILPGFHAVSGSTVHASITTTGTFCDGSASSSMVFAKPAEEKSETVEEYIKHFNQDIAGEKTAKVYPNPNNGRFTLALANTNEKSYVCIYNLTGTIFYQSVIETCQEEFNLPFLKKGIYLVRIGNGKDQFIRKMIVN